MKEKQSKPVAPVDRHEGLGGMRDLIIGCMRELSPQQRAIADYLLEHLGESPFLSVPQLAERTGTSEATVVRFCRSLGFGGFAEFKVALVDAMREETEKGAAGAERPVGADPQDVLGTVAELEQHNIRRTLEMIDREEYSSVAGVLAGADHIFTFGLGISACLAELAAYIFTEHGLRATCLSTRYTSPREQLVFLRQTDVVLAFSFPPYSRQTPDVLQEAIERGAATIAITDHLSAPASAVARHALLVSTEGISLTNTTASIDVLLNALAVEVAVHHRDDTLESLSRINRILREPAYLAAGK